MTSLHTWAGILLGGLMFVIFWMGTLSVFDKEIDRWMMPDTRLAHTELGTGMNTFIAQAMSLATPATTQIRLRLPTERTPILRLQLRDNEGNTVVRDMNPTTGELIPDQGTAGGTGFIFPFHFRLNLKAYNLGYWLVGLTAMAMLALLISGVVIHRKIISEFFVFRPEKRLRRSSLDIHNLTGVLGLPFHFIVTLSGMIIIFGIYFPTAHVSTFGLEKSAEAEFTLEAFGRYKREKANQPGPIASVDAMIEQATTYWSGDKPNFIRIWHPGDANSYIELRRSYADEVTMNLDQLYFDAASGKVLSQFSTSPVVSAQRFITGMHFIQFDHWPLRFLYFIGGISACIMIATGFIFWLEIRQNREQSTGRRLIHGMGVGSVTGVIIATLGFFIANRLLPLSFTAFDLDRAAMEMLIFYSAWVCCFVHAWLWPRHALQQQCLAILLLAMLAVILNWMTTGHHLLYSLTHSLWAVAGMDLMLLATAVGAGFALTRINRLRDQRQASLQPQQQSG